MPSLEEYVRGLDAETLAQLKRDLPLRIKSLAPETQKAVMERLGNFYQFQDLPTPVARQQPYQEPVQPPQTDIPLWQKGLNAFSWPFEKIHKYAFEPLAATVTAPFTPQAPDYQGEGLPWLGRQIAEYRAWESPRVQVGKAQYPQFMGGGPVTLGVKGALEMAPWLALPMVGQVGRAAAGVSRGATAARALRAGTLAGRGVAEGAPTGIAGALGQIPKVGRAIGTMAEWSPWGGAEKAALLPFKGASALARGAGKKGAKLTDAEILEQAAVSAPKQVSLEQLRFNFINAQREFDEIRRRLPENIPSGALQKAKTNVDIALRKFQQAEQAAKGAAPPVTKGAEAIPPTGEAVPGKAAAPAAKEPWQMTREEYSKSGGVETQGQRYLEQFNKDIAKQPPEFTQGILKEAGAGKPGLSVERVEKATTKGPLQHQITIAYRDSKGNPVGALIATEFESLYGGKAYYIDSLALDTNRGLIAGKAGRAMLDKVKELGIPIKPPEGATSVQARALSHRLQVEQALAEGKPVPPEVLKDYPDLAAKATTAPVEPPAPTRVPGVQGVQRPSEAAAAAPAVEGAAAAGRPPVPPIEPPPTPRASVPPAEPSAFTMPDLQDIGTLIDVASSPDFMRQLAQNPVFRPIAKALGGLSATARTPLEWAFVARNEYHREVESKATAVMSKLLSKGRAKKVFSLDADGLLSAGPLKGKDPNVITQFRREIYSQLTPEQQRWVDAFHEIEQGKASFLERNGLMPEKLSFEEGGEYASRRLLAKYGPDGEVVEVAYITALSQRLGAKGAWEGQRVFRNIEDAVKQGYKYMSPEDALALNVRGAYLRVADKRVADKLFETLPYRTTEIFSLPKASALVQDALRKKPIPATRLAALKRDMPDVAVRLETALAEPDWATRYALLKDTQVYLKSLVPSNTDDLFWAVENLAQRRKIAQNAIAVIQRAKRGEAIPTGTLKSIAKVMPEIGDKLSKNSKYVLEDLIKAGEEARRWPITLPRGPAFGKLKKLMLALQDAEGRLAIDPSSSTILKEIKEIRRQIGFTKYRIAAGEDLSLSKSPTTILTEDRRKALNEVLELVRGQPYETKTATGKVVTKFKGGIVSQFRIKELEAVGLRKEVRRQAQKVHLGEVALPEYPAFTGKILTGPDARTTAEFIRGELTPQMGRTLQDVNKINAVGRYFALAGDVSPFAIQLLWLPAYNPKAFGRAIGGFAKVMFNPEFRANYIKKNYDVIVNSPGLELLGSEFTEAFRKGGLLTTGIGKTMGKPLEPFQRGFDTALLVAGVEMKKSLQHLATTPQRNAMIDAFINEFRGVSSRAKIGVSPRQQQLWTAGLLAPRYTFAIATLLTDFLRGNLRGHLARQAMGQGVAAAAAMTVAISMALGESEEDIVNHLDPRSPKFMTWKVGGQNIGPGSKVRSVVRLWGQLAKDPEAATHADASNPLVRFVRGQLSPVLSTGWDLWTGENYSGDPARDGVLSLSRTVLGENLLPIWMQTTAFEGGDIEGRALRGAGEFFGLRTYPMSSGQKRDEMRDQLAQQQFGIKWGDLPSSMGISGQIAQAEIEQMSPELQTLTGKATKEYTQIARGEGKVWLDYKTEGREIDKIYRDAITRASLEFRATGDGVTFREKVNDAAKVRREMFGKRQMQAEYEPIRNYFARPLADADMQRLHPEELARREFYNAMYAPQMYDQYGNYDFRAAEAIEEAFIAHYGEVLLNRIRDLEGAKTWEGQMPEELNILRDAQRRLEPYWNMVEQAWASYPAEFRQVYDRWTILQRIDPREAKRFMFQYPQVALAIRRIDMEKKRFKFQNPEVAQLLRMYYSY